MKKPQKTMKIGCPCEDVLETKSNKGSCSITLAETERRDSAVNHEILIGMLRE